MRPLGAFCSLFALATAAVRTTAPKGSLVVGSGGKYATIQAAVNALSSSTTAAQVIFIQPGTYSEQVYIPALKGPLTIYGSTSDTTSYASNQVAITAGESQQTKASNDLTATLRVHTEDFSLYNVDVVNSFGKGSQAVALSAYAGKQGYYGVNLTGHQDTLLSQTSTQLYAKSYIAGATDFIFGQDAAAFFHKCDIRVLDASKGWITASGRSSASSKAIYVISESTIAAASGHSVTAGAYHLGRPWGAYARVVVQKTHLSSVINAAGWSVWNLGDERISGVKFGEYINTGKGSLGTRAHFSKKLSAAVTLAEVLGSDYTSWVDSTYL